MVNVFRIWKCRKEMKTRMVNLKFWKKSNNEAKWCILSLFLYLCPTTFREPRVLPFNFVLQIWTFYISPFLDEV